MNEWILVISIFSVLVSIGIAIYSISFKKDQTQSTQQREDLKTNLARLEKMIEQETIIRMAHEEKLAGRMDEIETNYNDKFKQVNQNIDHGTDRVNDVAEMIVEMKVNLRSFMKTQGYQYQES